MHRCRLVLVLMAAACLMGKAQAGYGPVTWDGGFGMWYTFEFSNTTTGNWNGGKNVLDPTVFGRDDGHGGYMDTNGGTDIIINGGFVGYDASETGRSFRLQQGDTMTISGGGVWEQKTLEVDSVNDPLADNGDGTFGTLLSWAEKGWTTMDLSSLNLDNGTFRRTGAISANVGDPGGGPLIFGSWRGDDNFGGDRDADNDVDGSDFLNWQQGDLNAVDLRKVRGMYGQNPAGEYININITNGGSLENEGQLWFGSEDSDFPTNVNVNINDGSITAIGGVPSADASDDFGGDFATDPDASIAFFKIGDNVNVQIDFTGPGSITTDEGAIRMLDFDTGIVTDLEYVDLWNSGILTANGSNSGAFGDFFSVTGNWGDASYVLTSLIPSASTAISAVPEPTSTMLAGLAVLSLAFSAHRRRT